MEEDIKSFLNYLAEKKKYSQNTLAAYNADLVQLASFIESEAKKGEAIEPSAPNLNASILSAYLRSLRERRYSLATVARKVAATKSFLKFMVDTGRVKGDLLPVLVPPRVSKPVRKALSVSEVRRLLAEPAKIDTVDAKRDKAMLELLYATGLRASELIALNISDIDLDKGTVRCLGRGSKVRTIPINRPVVRLMKAYLDKVRPELVSNESETALFLNVRGERLTRQGFWLIVQSYADRVGLSGKVTPRSLRNSFAAHKLKEGAELQSVQELLGHSHISTTKAYTHVEVGI